MTSFACAILLIPVTQANNDVKSELIFDAVLKRTITDEIKYVAQATVQAESDFPIRPQIKKMFEAEITRLVRLKARSENIQSTALPEEFLGEIAKLARTHAKTPEALDSYLEDALARHRLKRKMRVDYFVATLDGLLQLDSDQRARVRKIAEKNIDRLPDGSSLTGIFAHVPPIEFVKHELREAQRETHRCFAHFASLRYPVMKRIVEAKQREPELREEMRNAARLRVELLERTLKSGGYPLTNKQARLLRVASKKSVDLAVEKKLTAEEAHFVREENRPPDLSTEWLGRLDAGVALDLFPDWQRLSEKVLTRKQGEIWTAFLDERARRMQRVLCDVYIYVSMPRLTLTADQQRRLGKVMVKATTAAKSPTYFELLRQIGKSKELSAEDLASVVGADKSDQIATRLNRMRRFAASLSF